MKVLRRIEEFTIIVVEEVFIAWFKVDRSIKKRNIIELIPWFEKEDFREL